MTNFVWNINEELLIIDDWYLVKNQIKWMVIFYNISLHVFVAISILEWENYLEGDVGYNW